jgi:hypothetical protein
MHFIARAISESAFRVDGLFDLDNSAFIYPDDGVATEVVKVENILWIEQYCTACL